MIEKLHLRYYNMNMQPTDTTTAERNETPEYEFVSGAFALTIFSLMFWAFTGSLAWGVGLGWATIIFLSSLPTP